MLIGDISIWKLRHTSATFFNKDMYSANFGDPDELYQTVLDGKWTHEKFREVVKTVYSDVNNNGVADAGDIIGAATTPAAMNDHFSYTAGIRFTERDSDGYPKLITNHEKNNKIVETLYTLYFETPGMYICDRTMSGTVQDGDYKNWFVSGNMLLYPHRLYATENFRDMEDEYGIIPFPKLDENQDEYLALVSDATTVFAVPITKADIELPCAVLEAMCAENYRTVVPAYYDIALKVKYARDNIAGQMIDIIHDGTTTDFMYANNYAFDANNMGLITRELFYKKSKDYVSMYDSISKAVEESMNQMIAEIKK